MKQTLDFSLQPQNKTCLANLCGENDCNIELIATRLDIQVFNRGFDFRLVGNPSVVGSGRTIIESLYTQADEAVASDQVHLQIMESLPPRLQQAPEPSGASAQSTHRVDGAHADGTKSADYVLLRPPKKSVRTRGAMQKQFVEQIHKKTISFGIGPAGTGKTWLAVACAAQMLVSRQYERLIITRPAVEAGERLGFLPGDFSQKVDPYLRPVFDALYELLGFELTDSLIAKGVIEVAPLAFMRGRSFNHAFVLLDEAQNTTVEQMKMFLTRMGFGSQVVVTGDPMQIDLPANITSGLKHAVSILDQVPQVYITRFAADDIVRHPLVQSVVQAYVRDEQNTSQVSYSRKEDTHDYSSHRSAKSK